MGLKAWLTGNVKATWAMYVPKLNWIRQRFLSVAGVIAEKLCALGGEP